MIVDAYTHILPAKYQAGLEKKVPDRDLSLNSARYAKTIPTLVNLDARFKVMDVFEDYIQVISVASPPIYSIAPAGVAAELCRIANDELAELVDKHPDRFAAGIACLPLLDTDAAVAEAQRAIKDLRLRAVEFYTDINGKPLDTPEFMPIRDYYLKENALTYYRRFFYDTAVNGNTAALECGLAFAGLDRMVFATDMPFCNQMGLRLIRDTLESVERMQLKAEEKRKIFQENAVNLLRLPLGKF